MTRPYVDADHPVRPLKPVLHGSAVTGILRHHDRGGIQVAHTTRAKAVEKPSKSRPGRFGLDQPLVALVLVLISLSGCGGIAAQGRNAQGVALFQQGRFQEALKEFQEATYDDPADADGYYNLAATYHRLGHIERRQSDLDQAETYYNLCLDRNPNHTDCYRGLAVLLAEQGRKDDAFRLVEGWVQREPSAADPKIELARLNEEFGNRQVAKDHLIEALAAQPNNTRALTALGKIREDAGDRVQALANYQRSLSYDTRQPYVASRLTALQGTSASSVAAPAGETGTRIADRGATQSR